MSHSVAVVLDCVALYRCCFPPCMQTASLSMSKGSQPSSFLIEVLSLLLPRHTTQRLINPVKQTGIQRESTVRARVCESIVDDRGGYRFADLVTLWPSRRGHPAHEGGRGSTWGSPSRVKHSQKIFYVNSCARFGVSSPTHPPNTRRQEC